MLWVLDLCADAGIRIMDYRDESEGIVAEHANGSGEFTRVVLRPRMTITDAMRASDAAEIHHRAHALCALARSVKFDVECEPPLEAVGTLQG
jgi:organic hydroperoxide reductase OsmC/OhrA